MDGAYAQWSSFGHRSRNRLGFGKVSAKCRNTGGKNNTPIRSSQKKRWSKRSSSPVNENENASNHRRASP